MSTVATSPDAGMAPASIALNALPQAPYRVLVVDDEANVLSALQRALRARGYQVISAASGAEGLEKLALQAPHAIISDMRMPGMHGAAFLKAARAACPDTIRLLLTGHADVNSAVLAVNEGEVYRYFTKPWDDDKLAQALDDGLAQHRLRAERDHLLQLTRQQNTELLALNHTLEGQVQARTAALQQALTRAEDSQQQLKRGFIATMHLFASLVEARAGLTRGCARRVTEHVRRVGPRLQLGITEQQDTVFAAMLVDLGKVMLPDRLTQVPLSDLSPDDRRQFLAHPEHATSLMMGVDMLRGAAGVLQALHACFDGGATPSPPLGEQIPLGARLLAVAAEYEALQSGAVTRAKLPPGEALRALQQAAGQRFDPHVVTVFAASLLAPKTPCRQRRTLTTGELQPGMQLAEDLLSRDGFLLLARGHVIDAALINHLMVHQSRNDTRLKLTVLDPEN